MIDKDKIKKDNVLIDDLYVFINQYRSHIEPQSRSYIVNLLERLVKTIKEYQENIEKLDNDIESNKLLFEYYSSKILKFESSYSEIKSKITETLNIPFVGKTSEQANKRLGMDEGLHTALEIIDETLENIKNN